MKNLFHFSLHIYDMLMIAANVLKVRIIISNCSWFEELWYSSQLVMSLTNTLSFYLRNEF